MTTTNPSLAVDNDAERRALAWSAAHKAVNDLHRLWAEHREVLENENQRLRAALTEAEQPLANGWDHQLEHAAQKQEIQHLQHILAETERRALRLAKELDEEVARTPRLRQEQTARIAELEAEVAALKAETVPRCPNTRAMAANLTRTERCAGAAGHRSSCFGGVPPPPGAPFDEQLPHPAGPAVPVIEVSGKFVCKTCMDTHRVDRHDGSVVMCTRCPRPCRKCAVGEGRGAYCETTPCACDCHEAKPAGEL
jgi:hypothetical protein